MSLVGLAASTLSVKGVKWVRFGKVRVDRVRQAPQKLREFVPKVSTASFKHDNKSQFASDTNDSMFLM